MDRAGEILQTRSMFGMELGLERITAILEHLDNPQRSFHAIHVVGTNGKSSTTRFIAAALAAQGAKTGAYLSPHINGWNERVLIADPRRLPAPIAAEAFADAIAAAEAAAVKVDTERGGACTQFEVLTAGAFVALREAGVEVAAIEAGLGGRLDATNVLDAPVVVLTGVALEHTEHLGDTRELIAAEKLAVLRPGAVLVAGGMDDEIRPTVERLAAEPHLIVSATGSISEMDTVFIDNGLERRVIWDDDGAYLGAMSRAGRTAVTGMTAPDSITALAIAAETDILALAPLRMARHFGPAFSLVIKPPPYETSPIDVCALWRRDQGSHPAVGWLIELLQAEGHSV